MIPNSITNIGSSAFSSCTGLTNVTIGAGVTTIGSQALSYCTSLTAIMVDPLNSAYSSADGLLFNKNQTTLIQCPGGKTGSYIIPNGVTTIADYAFQYCDGLASVTIPSVTSIGSYAFYNCTDLTHVTVGSGVTAIADYAFSYCTGLQGGQFAGTAPSLCSSVITMRPSITCQEQRAGNLHLAVARPYW